MEFENNDDNLIFKHMGAVGNSIEQRLKMIQSLVNWCILTTCALKQSLTMAVRIKLLSENYLVCSYINESCDAFISEVFLASQVIQK